jgi:hypothetical protein
LKDLTSIGLQLHPSIKGSFSLIIRVADIGKPGTPYSVNRPMSPGATRPYVLGFTDGDVVDLVWTLSSQNNLQPTLNAWNDFTDLQNGRWGFVRRSCGPTSATGFPSRCNALDNNIIGGDRCNIVQLFEPSNARLFDYFNKTYSQPAGSSTCNTFTLSQNATVVAVLLDVSGISGASQTYYADNLRLSFRATTFPTTGVPAPGKTVNYRTNFERYPKVTLGADLIGH